MSLPPMPAGVRKVFVAYLDTHYGQHLTAKLLAKDYEVSGLVRDPTAVGTLSPKLKKVLRRGDADAVRKALLEADLVIYQLVDTVEDAVAAVRLLTTNHFETEKRFVLVSSVMTWFETPPLVDPAPADDGEEPELEALTEDQYNRRVPHVKYLAWRDMEKMACSAHGERLKTFVVFAGLQYGCGEDHLHPLFKQAWTLAPEGLPIFGTGKQVVPMIHTTDLVTLTTKLLAVEELPENRYIFANDDGNCAWKDVVGALNTAMGNGKTFRVPSHEFGLYDHIEHFVVNLRLDAQTIQTLMPDEADWVSKAGFVEGIGAVCAQYRAERHVTPLRIVVLGPPSSGKSVASRELSSALGVPHFTIADIIAEYKYQETELREELARAKDARYKRRVREKMDEKRQQLLEERRAAAEAALAEAAAAVEPNEDNDDVEEEEEVDATLSPDEDRECREAAEDDEGDERVAAVNEKLEEIRRVLLMREKPIGEVVVEPPNPKDKKKPAPKKDAKKAAAQAEPEEEPNKEVRLGDRALAIMVRWKLTRTQCRNQGYVLDGFPKSIRQARLVFEADLPLEVPEDPENEPDMPLDKEEKPVDDGLFPDFVLHCKAGDSFLLERLQKTQFEHPHNAPEEFQRRLEAYKANFEAAVGVVGYFESARTAASAGGPAAAAAAAGGRTAHVKAFDMEACPLVPPPAPKSAYAPRPVDPVIQRMLDVIGKPHNFGPTPQDARREAERARLLAAEQQAELEAQTKKRKEKEATDVVQAQKAKSEEAVRVSAMKENERQMLEQRKGPLKAYLMANVIPVLTKGLIEICNQRPEDPVDALAEWLFKHNPEDHPEMY